MLNIVAEDSPHSRDTRTLQLIGILVINNTCINCTGKLLKLVEVATYHSI